VTGYITMSSNWPICLSHSNPLLEIINLRGNRELFNEG